MALNFDATNWYWTVGGSSTQVYSSAAGNYVPSTDSAYQAWVASGGVATSIASEAELGGVLAPYSLRPAPANVLDAYQGAQADGLTIQAVAKAVFYLANQVRALQGQGTLTAAQFRSLLKSLM